MKHGGSSPGIFDREVTVGKCQVNRFGEANCGHVHAGDLPSQNAGGWAGDPEDLVPLGWTAQSPTGWAGEQEYECCLCHATMTLEMTTDHVCAL